MEHLARHLWLIIFLRGICDYESFKGLNNCYGLLFCNMWIGRVHCGHVDYLFILLAINKTNVVSCIKEIFLGQQEKTLVVGAFIFCFFVLQFLSPATLLCI